MQIIETVDDFTALVESSSFEPYFMIPILCDVKAHPVVNPLSVLFVSTRTGDKYMFLFDHNDGQKLPAECKERLAAILDNGQGTIYVPNKKTLLHVLPFNNHYRLKDTSAIDYIHSAGKLQDVEKVIPTALRGLYARFWQFPNLNRAAPLMKLLELCEAVGDQMQDILTRNATSLKYEFGEAYDFLNDVMIPATRFLESKGVHVDREKFIQHYGEKAKSVIVNDLVYTDYNPYTATGRVTNRHGGINYAAINKSDGTREAYTSRHRRGAMVMIDFESFHLRLIARMLLFDAPKEPFHVYLAKQYFDTDNPTPEEYEEGKKITFQNLYSHNRRMDIPFFNKVTEWESRTWKSFEEGANISSGGRIWNIKNMENPSASKMFNYFLQWKETQTAFQLIDRLEGLYRNRSSVVSLYTYDSLLIDFDMDDGAALLKDTVTILEDFGRYPVRVYSGPSYANLKNVTEKVKTDKSNS